MSRKSSIYNDSGNAAPMQQALAVRPEQQALAVQEDYDEEDLAALPPELPREKFDGHTGIFTNALTGETTRELRLAVLGIKYSNVYFPPIGSHGAKWICRSIDTIHGTLNPDYLAENEPPENVSGLCATCPALQWTQKEKPLCSHGLNILCINTETGMPFVLTAARTSLRPWEKLLNSFKLLRKRPYADEIQVTSELHEKPGLKWYVMKPVKGNPFPPEQKEEYRAIRDSLIRPFDAKVTEEIIVESVVESGADLGDGEDIPF